MINEKIELDFDMSEIKPEYALKTRQFLRALTTKEYDEVLKVKGKQDLIVIKKNMIFNGIPEEVYKKLIAPLEQTAIDSLMPNCKVISQDEYKSILKNNEILKDTQKFFTMLDYENEAYKLMTSLLDNTDILLQCGSDNTLVGFNKQDGVFTLHERINNSEDYCKKIVRPDLIKQLLIEDIKNKKKNKDVI